jgi:uncharacterized protein (DUF4415 family)
MTGKEGFMTKRKPLTDDSGEVREITAADLKDALRFDQLPEALQTRLRTRGPQKAPTKEQISIRLSTQVLDEFRAFGAGWQTRIDQALQEWLNNHRPA